MIAKDEEANIGRALTSVASVADEMIVVDTGSRDRTASIAKEIGARVVKHEWRNDFSEARNFATGLAANDWVLHLDADEELDDADPARMADLLSSPRVDAYWCQLVNQTRRSSSAGAVGSRSIRLFRPAKYEYSGIIHEQAVPKQQGAANQQWSDLTILHWGYADPSKSEERAKRNMTLLKRILADDPSNYMFRFYLGVELMNSRNYNDAIEEFRQAESLLPRDAHEHRALFLLNLCESLGRGGRVEEGLEYGERAAKIFPDYRDIIYIVGELNLMAGRLDQAADFFRQCAQMTKVSGKYLSAREGLDKMALRKLRRLRAGSSPPS